MGAIEVQKFGNWKMILQARYEVFGFCPVDLGKMEIGFVWVRFGPVA